MSIFKACDIRGVVDVEWDTADARAIGRSLGQLMRVRGEAVICVGGDFRRSTPRLKRSLTDGLLETGANVLDVGQQATPIVYSAARHLGCRNVAIVTASHNPGKYNGIKFLIGGQPPVPTILRELESGMSEPLPPEPSGTLDTRDVLPAYERWVVQQAHELADAWKLRSAADSPNVSLRIVVDTMAGAFTHVAPRVLASAGHLVTPLGGEIDPDFAARTPNPSEDANLEPLIEAVMRERADLGVAFDGDGDRVIFVDAHGQIVRPEQIAVLLVQHCFERPTVVYDLKCASILSRAVEAVGGRAIMQPSGHGFIKATMIEERAELGVEVSGHHFFGVLDGGDDGLFTALLVAEIVTQTNRSLAELIAPIGWPAITPDLRVPFSGDATEAIEAIGRTCGGHVTRLDGVRAAYDHGWALARASITEPAITFRFEGRDQADLRRVVAQFLAAVPALCRQVMEMIDE